MGGEEVKPRGLKPSLPREDFYRSTESAAPPKAGSGALGLMTVAAVVVGDAEGRADGNSEKDAMKHQSEDGASAHADAQSG
jgi:hypothetical protein